jgi:hypothetical protein
MYPRHSTTVRSSIYTNEFFETVDELAISKGAMIQGAHTIYLLVLFLF